MILESERMRIGAIVSKKVMRHDDDTVYVDHPQGLTDSERRHLFKNGWKIDYSYHNHSITFIRETTSAEQDIFDKVENIEDRLEELAEESKRIERNREPGPAYGILDDARKEGVQQEYETLYEAHEELCGLAGFEVGIMKFSDRKHMCMR